MMNGGRRNLMAAGAALTALAAVAGESRTADTGAESSQSAVAAAAVVAGTWTLLSYQEQRPNGDWVDPPLGAGLTSWIMYDGHGHVCVQITRSDRVRFASDDLYAGQQYAGTLEEKARAYDGYGAYCATYTVDERTASIVHHVELSLFPNLVGSDQKRSYHFDAGRLILDTEPFERDGETRSARLIWERLP